MTPARYDRHRALPSVIVLLWGVIMSLHRDSAAPAGSLGHFSSLAFAILLLSGTAHATDSYVSIQACPPDSLPYPKGIGTGSLEDPFCLIQDGIDAAKDADRVLVLPGSYYRQFANMRGKAIQLIGTGGALATRFAGRSDTPTCELQPYYPSIGPFITCDEGEGRDTVIQGFEFFGGSAHLGGGVLNDNGSSPTIKDCVFNDNYGGAIGNLNGASPHIIGCTFRCNGDGEVSYYVPRCAINNRIDTHTLVENRAFERNGPGAICDQGAYTQVLDSTFVNNYGWVVVDGIDYPELEFVSAVNPSYGSEAVIEGCTFDVGGIQLTGSKTSILSSNFYNGAGIWGLRSVLGLTGSLLDAGSAYSGSGTLILRGSHFRGQGSGVISGDGVLQAEDCVFEDNSRDFNYDVGSCIAWQRGEVFVHRCTFKENRGYGGAVSISNVLAIFTESTFERNTRGIYVYGSSVDIERCRFLTNSSAQSGGALKVGNSEVHR